MMTCNTSGKKGYDKIKRCCEIALSDGFKYVWVDTCCIDKTSSSELTEAINSMYRWYENSAVCYPILSGVRSDEHYYLRDSKFRASRWFTRGWTLQELIAPSNVVFYGRDWKEIGTKSSLRDIISQITEIHVGILSRDMSLHGFSVVQKMSCKFREPEILCLLWPGYLMRLINLFELPKPMFLPLAALERC